MPSRRNFDPLARIDRPQVRASITTVISICSTCQVCQGYATPHSAYSRRSGAISVSATVWPADVLTMESAAAVMNAEPWYRVRVLNAGVLSGRHVEIQDQFEDLYRQ